MLVKISEEIDKKELIPRQTHIHLQMLSAFVLINLQKLSMKAFASVPSLPPLQRLITSRQVKWFSLSIIRKICKFIQVKIKPGSNQVLSNHFTYRQNVIGHSGQKYIYKSFAKNEDYRQYLGCWL
jgi:hypothetical protein